MFKVGDRVKISSDGRKSFFDNNFGTGSGEVISIASWIDVQWDEGEINCYRLRDLILETPLSLENE